MTALRLGVACAIFDDEGRILLSRRGDLNIWNLPTGRLDQGELLADAARREVQEETGLEVDIVRPVGLYYSDGRDRMNVLFEGKATGGDLKAQTAEATANQYFMMDALPDNLFGEFMIKDAVKTGVSLYTLESSAATLRRLQVRLAWRWIKNLFSGRPEPRYPHFNVHASLVLRNTEGDILTIPHANHERILPGIAVNGQSAPWEQVQEKVRHRYDMYELRDATLSWRGLWENPATHTLEFIFQADIEPASAPVDNTLQWTSPMSRDWWQDYLRFAQHVMENTNTVLSIVANHHGEQVG